jgi:hypothetical protein
MSTFISEPGTRLGGRYRLEDRVAAESGWAAWKAIDEILARAVTVYTFAPGFPRIQEVITAARAASRLPDSRLGQVFDVEDDWDRAYVVMEWAAGDSLEDLLAAGPLDPVPGARIVAEAAGALAVAHAAGLAHLRLTPACLRIGHGGGVKVVGLGIDAALAGVTDPEPALADTAGLGRLLYAAMTARWPGPDYPALPPAPVADGVPRRPRQVQAGVPAALDDVTCRALQIPGREGEAGLRQPAELASALLAVIPPVPPPPASPDLHGGRGGRGRADTGRRDRAPRDGHYPDDRDREYRLGADTAGPSRRGRSAATTTRLGRTRRRSRGRAALVVVAALIVVGAIVAATSAFWHSAAAPHRAVHRHFARPGHTSAPAASVIVPQQAAGYDPLTPVGSDPGNENTTQAGLAIDGNPSTYWSTQYYDTAAFGDLKKGSGLILRLPGSDRLSSVQVVFGAGTGTNVQLKLGSSDARDASALDSMTTIARRHDVTGRQTFIIKSPAAGRYLLIWFTQLGAAPPSVNGASGKYLAQVFNVVLHGSSS